jgi:FKBP-type peptidyl-prolyl cis-trans isomerase 2
LNDKLQFELSSVGRDIGGDVMGYIKLPDIIEVSYPENLINDSEMIDAEDDGKLEINIGRKKTYLNLNEGTAQSEIGARKTITVPAAEAFGPKREGLIIELKKEHLPDKVSPAKGQTVRIEQRDGKKLDASVVDLKDESIVLDANHPLAGKTLVFDIELVAVSY